MSYTPNSTRYNAMMYRNAGKSGLKLPAISLGFWHNFGNYNNVQDMKAICFAAFDNGVTHFDLANNYGFEAGAAERNLGRILTEDLHAYRDELVISTKAGFEIWPGPYGRGGSRKYLSLCIDKSLDRMGIDYVDIFYHQCMDRDTPLEETMQALNQIVQSGKALYIGLSNYDGDTLKKATAILNDLKCPYIVNILFLTEPLTRTVSRKQQPIQARGLSYIHRWSRVSLQEDILTVQFLLTVVWLQPVLSLQVMHLLLIC